jgi:hypothetical protein
MNSKLMKSRRTKLTSGSPVLLSLILIFQFFFLEPVCLSHSFRLINLSLQGLHSHSILQATLLDKKQTTGKSVFKDINITSRLTHVEPTSVHHNTSLLNHLFRGKCYSNKKVKLCIPDATLVYTLQNN